MNADELKVENISVVYTSKALCRDCYRCVRVCPVNAIRMVDGQANVVPERCISCGTCITVCPQSAKTYRTEYGKVLQMFEIKDRIAISIAPSYVSYYNEWERKRLPSALRMLGFDVIEETSTAAWYTAQATAEYIEKNKKTPAICTACPAAVNYIRYQMPDLVKYLVPIASPMATHARMIKEANKGIRVVFAGPCVAKKDEATWKSLNGIVDAVITFEELDELFRLKDIRLKECEQSKFDSTVYGTARLFPIEGGLLKTAGISDSLTDLRTMALSGAEEIKDALENLQANPVPCVIEPSFCRSGCINGPVMRKERNSFAALMDVYNYSKENPGSKPTKEVNFENTSSYFSIPESVHKTKFTEEQIREVLSKTGKLIPTDELNCTACGYNSCRDRAIAVLEGMAEPEMCMPYMRRLAEQKADTIIEQDPNGFVLMNSELEILRMNQSFKDMFSCSDSVIGRKISYLIDPAMFEKLISGEEKVLKSYTQYQNYNLLCHVIAYRLYEKDQIVGLFVDVTDSKMSKDKLDDLKNETVTRSGELIDHLLEMSQEMARFLGENTAKGEVLMNNLIDSINK